MIKREALFSDETELFKTPYEPLPGDNVTLRLRTLADGVNVAYCVVNGVKHTMEKVRSDANFDYYEITFICPDHKVSYYFTAFDDEDRVVYNKLGCVENNQSEFNFVFYPGFKVPDWAKGAVFYQIFTDRFYNGNSANNVENNEYYYTGGHVKRVKDWDKYPEQLDVHCFYGGDLQGVREKLDYLQDLGIEAIYFNPLFLSPSNHKYDAQDYDYIDPHLAVIVEDTDHEMEWWEHHNGFAKKYIKRTTSQKNLDASNEFFADFVKEIHSRGMRVIIDGVFNHCGSFHKWMDKEGIYLNKKGYSKGAYQSAKSPYRSYFNFHDKDNPQNGYDGWWGFDTLPKLNYENSPKLVHEIMNVAKKWVSEPYNVDGWRLDVAADLGYSAKYNHKFWRKFRQNVREANPEAFIFAEHYGDASAWFNGREWDSVMNYDAFMEPVTWFLTGMEKHSENFDGTKFNDGKLFFDSMSKNMSRFPRPALDSALNQLSNHDHSRFMTRTNGMVGTLASRGPEAAGEHIDERVFKLGVMIQMTWPGSPGIYYADEAGQVGWTDPDSRRTYPWGRENHELIDFHKKLIALRHNIHCMKMGSLIALDSGNGYIVYGRFDKEDCAVIVINNSDRDLSLSIPVWELGLGKGDRMQLELDSNQSGFNSSHPHKEVKYGRLWADVAAKSGKIYSTKFRKQ